ncbi:MAG: hypothetical protein ACI3ZK_02235 [Candidatus Cryptobacteroides sp.]
MAYDLEKKEPREFRLARIKEIEVLPERWILDTHLHGWGAIVRFYVGNCGGSKKEIEILDTEDSDALKEEIRKYIAEVSC